MPTGCVHSFILIWAKLKETGQLSKILVFFHSCTSSVSWKWQVHYFCTVLSFLDYFTDTREFTSQLSKGGGTSSSSTLILTAHKAINMVNQAQRGYTFRLPGSQEVRVLISSPVSQVTQPLESSSPSRELFNLISAVCARETQTQRMSGRPPAHFR